MIQETLDPSTRASIIFARLKDLPADSRARALDVECANDQLLRAEIESLLEASDRDLVAVARTPTPEALPLRGPARPNAVPDSGAAPRPLGPGSRIAGRYRLVKKIGSGGLSVVYLAHQESPVERDVALKLLAPGIHTESVVARFEGERNALSRMSHPYVAQIHDAGTTEVGQAFVAMEYIDGLPIDLFCKQYDLDLAQRLALLVKVCRGVAHAHQKGIIHRDLKPTNILVVASSDGGEPIPKVIDFGIAKSVTGSLTSGAGATRVGFVVGTPGYMSPEQASAGEVDTTTDVYSLGVILYELMTGSLPIAPPAPDELDMHTWHQRLLSTRIEPMSQRLASFGLGRKDVARALGPSSAIDPKSLVGDLDIIAHKAMAAEPDNRYRTVSELATDIERTLTGEPILARPPSIGYLLGRVARRHRGVVVASALILVAAIIAGIVFANLLTAKRVADEEVLYARERAASEERHAAERIAAAERTRARGAVAAAQAAVQARNTAAAQRNLDAVPPELRAWEWRWLAHTTEQSERVIRAHRSAVNALALSSDEAILASLGEAGMLRLWSTVDGTPIDALQAGAGGATDDVHGLALSLEHELAVTSDRRTTMCAWDLVTHRALWCRSGVFGFFPESLDPIGELVVGTPVGLEVVAIESGQTMMRIAAPAGTAFAMWAQPGAGEDERLLLAWGNDTTMALELPRAADSDGATIVSAHVRWRRQGTVSTMDPTERVVVIKRWGRLAERDVVDVATGDTITTFTSRGPSLAALELDGDGVVAAVEIGLAVSIRPRLGDPPLAELLGHRATITAARSGRKTFWFGDASGAIRQWSADVLPTPARVARSNDVVFAGAVGLDGERVFSAGWGMVKAWSVATGAELWSHWLGRAYVFALAATAREVVTADGDGRVMWLDASDGTPTQRAQPTDEVITALALHDERVLVGTLEGHVVSFDRRADEVVWTSATHRAAIGALAIHPGGSWLAVAGGLAGKLPRRVGVTWADRRDGRVLLVDTSSGAIVRTLTDTRPGEESEGWLSLAFSPDGSMLVGGAADGTFTIWSLDPSGEREPVVRMPSLGLEVRALAFTPDGERLFVGDEHGIVQIWAVDELEHLATLPGVGGMVVRLATTQGGEVLVAMSDAYALAVFDPRPVTPERRAEESRWLERARIRERLDPIVDRLGGTEAVIAAIDGDAHLGEVRDALRAMARARGDNPNELNSWAWATLRYPGEPPDAIAQARVRAETCANGWALWEFENTRAVARLRDGDPGGAIASAEQSIVLGGDRGVSAFPTELAVIAMAKLQLGDRTGAAEALTRAQSALQVPPWDTDGEARSIVDEAVRALAP